MKPIFYDEFKKICSIETFNELDLKIQEQNSEKYVAVLHGQYLKKVKKSGIPSILATKLDTFMDQFIPKNYMRSADLSENTETELPKLLDIEEIIINNNNNVKFDNEEIKLTVSSPKLRIIETPTNNASGKNNINMLNSPVRIIENEGKRFDKIVSKFDVKKLIQQEKPAKNEMQDIKNMIEIPDKEEKKENTK